MLFLRYLLGSVMLLVVMCDARGMGVDWGSTPSTVPAGTQYTVEARAYVTSPGEILSTASIQILRFIESRLIG